MDKTIYEMSKKNIYLLINELGGALVAFNNTGDLILLNSINIDDLNLDNYPSIMLLMKTVSLLVNFSFPLGKFCAEAFTSVREGGYKEPFCHKKLVTTEGFSIDECLEKLETLLDEEDLKR